MMEGRHVFSLCVTQNGVQLKKTAEDDEDEMISNKKPQKAARAKEKLYGFFVKVINPAADAALHGPPGPPARV